MPSIDHLIIEADDPTVHGSFYADAFALGPRVQVRGSTEPTSGFRGFTLSLVVPGPAGVDALAAAAVEAGGRVLKAASKSLWGYGGVVQAPDGTVVTLASSSKKDTGPADGTLDELVLQLGVDDVAASKRFYTEQGLTVGQSFGRKYVTFETGPVTLALYQRRALAKTAGVPPEGTGSHRVAVAADTGPFTDPDGFVWERTTASA